MFHIFDGISLEPLENLENRYNPYILVSENSLDPLYTNSAEFVARSYEDLLSQLDCKTDLDFFKSLYTNYPDITVQIFASPKQYAILFLKCIKLIFGKNLGKEKCKLVKKKKYRLFTMEKKLQKMWKSNPLLNREIFFIII